MSPIAPTVLSSTHHPESHHGDARRSTKLALVAPLGVVRARAMAWRATVLVLAAGLALGVGMSGCTRDAEHAPAGSAATTPGTDGTPGTANTPGTDSAKGADVLNSASGPNKAASAADAADAARFALPLRDGDAPLLFPIHQGVRVAVAPSPGGAGDGGVVVSYTRSRGQPFGAAFMLAGSGQPQRDRPDLLKDASRIVVAMRSTPAMRPQLCLTDQAGNVWNAPLTASQGGELAFDLKAVQPDPFQNSGRTLPSKPDLANLRMLTLVDISGFTGAPEAACEWTIARIEVHADASGGTNDAGGAR